MSVEQLLISKINRNGGTQSRAQLDEKTVELYKADYLKGDIFPHVVVFFDGSEYWLADGFTRTEARERAGFKVISAEIKQGTQRDAILYSAGANASHGLRRSSADKRRAVVMLLEDHEWGKWSDRQIAKKTKTSHPYVGKIRNELESTGNISSVSERTFSRNGHITTMKTKEIGQHTAIRKDAVLTVLAVDEMVLSEIRWAKAGEDVFGRSHPVVLHVGTKESPKVAVGEWELVAPENLVAKFGEKRFKFGWKQVEEVAGFKDVTELQRAIREQIAPLVTVGAKIAELDAWYDDWSATFKNGDRVGELPLPYAKSTVKRAVADERFALKQMLERYKEAERKANEEARLAAAQKRKESESAETPTPTPYNPPKGFLRQYDDRENCPECNQRIHWKGNVNDGKGAHGHVKVGECLQCGSYFRRDNNNFNPQMQWYKPTEDVVRRHAYEQIVADWGGRNTVSSIYWKPYGNYEITDGYIALNMAGKTLRLSIRGLKRDFKSAEVESENTDQPKGEHANPATVAEPSSVDDEALIAEIERLLRANFDDNHLTIIDQLLEGQVLTNNDGRRYTLEYLHDAVKRTPVFRSVSLDQLTEAIAVAAASFVEFGDSDAPATESQGDKTGQHELIGATLYLINGGQPQREAATIVAKTVESISGFNLFMLDKSSLPMDWQNERWFTNQEDALKSAIALEKQTVAQLKAWLTAHEGAVTSLQAQQMASGR